MLAWSRATCRRAGLSRKAAEICLGAPIPICVVSVLKLPSTAPAGGAALSEQVGHSSLFTINQALLGVCECCFKRVTHFTFNVVI